MFMYVNVYRKLERQYAETRVFGMLSCCVHQWKYIWLVSFSRVTLYTAGHLHTAVPHCWHSCAPIVHTAMPRENNQHGCVYLRCRAVCKLPGCVEGHPWFWPVLGVFGLYPKFEFADGCQRMYKSWCSKEEVPYNCSRSSIKFQDHRAEKSMTGIQFE